MNILVIENNKEDYVLIKSFLINEYSNPNIHYASNWEESRRYIDNNNILDIVLLNYLLPDLSGIPLIKAITKKAKRIPIVVLISQKETCFGPQLISYGVEDFLFKDDLTPSLLSKTINYSIERQQILSKRKNSEKKYRDLFQLSPIPKWVYDIDSLQFLDFNQAAIEHYGYSAEEFRKKTLLDFIPDTEKKRVKNNLKEIRQNPEILKRGIYSLLTKNGNEVKIDINGRPIDFGNHRARMVVAIDLTEHITNLKLLKKTNKKLQAAQEIGKTGYWEMYLDTKKVFWSKELYNILELDPNNATPSYESYYAMIHPRDQKRFKASRENLLSESSKNNFSEIENWIICGNKQKKYVYQKTFLINKNGLPHKLEGIIQDITSQKLEREKSELLESVITHTKDAVLITDNQIEDAKGPKILYVNNAFLDITGYKKEEVVGRSPNFLYGSNMNKRALAKLKLALQKENFCELETINLKKSGEAFWSSMTIAPVDNEYEGTTHWIAILRDITSVKNYIKTIETQNQKLREIAWTQSHITRAPLAKIMGLINLMCEDLTNISEIQELLPLVQESASELDQIFRKINKMTSNIDTRNT